MTHLENAGPPLSSRDSEYGELLELRIILGVIKNTVMREFQSFQLVLEVMVVTLVLFISLIKPLRKRSNREIREHSKSNSHKIHASVKEIKEMRMFRFDPITLLEPWMSFDMLFMVPKPRRPRKRPSLSVPPSKESGTCTTGSRCWLPFHSEC
jgi:hypothetical protein